MVMEDLEEEPVVVEKMEVEEMKEKVVEREVEREEMMVMEKEEVKKKEEEVQEEKGLQTMRLEAPSADDFFNLSLCFFFGLLILVATQLQTSVLLGLDYGELSLTPLPSSSLL